MTAPVSATSVDSLCLELARDRELALLLDLDGTLVPFAPTPAEARLDAGVVDLLHRLRRAGVRLVVVSGRPRALVEPLRAEVDGICWFAEHGSWSCDDRGTWHGPTDARELAELVRVFEPFALVPGARLKTKSLSVCLHWRMVSPAAKPDLIEALRRRRGRARRRVAHEPVPRRWARR